ncbi:MAG: YkgJ family cysteine cluster protein [Acidimicrobiales bacterium]
MPTTAISAPLEITSVDELLDAARVLVDSDVRGIAARPEFPISCGPGCGACCRQAVPVTAAELRAVRAWLDGLPDDERMAHERRIAATKTRLDAANAEAIGIENERAYFALGIACPFLVDESCSIHPARPLACRRVR